MNNVLYSKASFFRNLKDYKFVPKITSEKKAEITEKLLQVLPNFKHITATNLDEKTKKFLTKNYLLNEGNNILIDDKNDVIIKLFNGELCCLLGNGFGFQRKSCYNRSKCVNRYLKLIPIYLIEEY